MSRAGFFLLLCLLVAAPSASAQIIDTLQGFDADARGFQGTAGASVRATGGNTKLIDLAGDLGTQYEGDAHRLRWLLGYGFSRKDREDVSDEFFTHLRHNRRIVPGLRTLLFVQAQRNPFQRLRSRWLLGAGLRFEPVRGERRQVVVGLAHMVEIEEIQDQAGRDTDQRISTFVDVVIGLGEGARLSARAFVQPRWSDLSDLRAIAALDLQSRVVASLSLFVTGSLVHDSHPPDRVEETDWGVKSGLRVDL